MQITYGLQKKRQEYNQSFQAHVTWDEVEMAVELCRSARRKKGERKHEGGVGGI